MSRAPGCWWWGQYPVVVQWRVEGWGYEVETAANIAEAVAKLEQQGFDLALLDIKLKNESGIDLLQKIVKERHDMPVILCSAFSCYKDDFSAWLADSYVVKSGDLTELKEGNQAGISQVVKMEVQY